MFHDKTILRVSISVSILLVLAFALTGFLSSVYRREKVELGEMHFTLGQQMEKKSDVEGAVEEYRKALLYSPDKSEYRLSFAAALIKAGRLDEAESHIDQMLQEDPTNGILNLMRGRIAVQRHELNKAIDYYERAVYEYWPPSGVEDRRQARWELIKLLDQAGRREQGIGELMTMYANAPSDTNLRLRIGFDLLKRSASSEGLQVFRDLMRTAPRNPLTHRGLGQALLTEGDFVSARHEFERALKMDPKDRASADALNQTNAIIDINPEMPSLTSAERYRRSQNLLRRVLAQVADCPDAAGSTNVSAARTLLEDKASRDPDAALRIQKAAVELWNMRTTLCGSSKSVNDPNLAIVMERITNE